MSRAQTKEFALCLRTGLEELEVQVEETLHGRLLDYFTLLTTWNQKIRLVGRAGTVESFQELIVDSLSPLRILKDGPGRMVDCGSGAGLPGLLLAVARPDWHVVSLEPVRKKLAFQQTARRELRLENFEPIPERVEQHGTHDYDIAISRAAFPLAEWESIGARMVCDTGSIFGFAKHGAELPPSFEVHPYTLGNRERWLVVRKPG